MIPYLQAESIDQHLEPGNGQDDAFKCELQHLQREVLGLGDVVKDAIVGSVEVLQQRAPTGSRPLITLDHFVTKKRFAIELDCITLIATLHPVGEDLRAIASMLEIATEFEHIGNYITDIAKIHFMIVQVEDSLQDLLALVQQMSLETRDMLCQALQAFKQQNPNLARAVHVRDDKVDALYREFYQQALVFMVGKPRATIKQVRYLTQIGRNLERSADRVTNICEWVVFAATGFQGQLFHSRRR